jgi:homoserine kinase type II
MADYSKINLLQANEILSLYGLPEATELIAQGHGISNTNYQVKFEKHPPVLLKISNDKAYNQVYQEQEILLYLKSQNFDLALTPYLTTLDNSPVYTWEKFNGVVYPYVVGKIEPITTEGCEKIGKALASLHLIKSSPKLRGHTSVGFGLTEIEHFIQNPLCPKDFSQAFLRLMSEKERALFHQTKFASGLIHGDLYFDNVMSNNGEIVKLLDFEQAGLGEFILDLGISISGSCLTSGQIDAVLVSAFVRGYESIRALEEQEKNFLHFSIVLGLFSISLWENQTLFNWESRSP